MVLNPLAAPFAPSEGLTPPPPWPALSCASLSPSLPSYTLHDLILAVLTAYKQGLFDAHIASPSQSYANPPPPTVVTPSTNPSPLSSPSVADHDSGSASALPHPSPSLPIQQEELSPTAVPPAAFDNPTPPTISTPLDYSCLIDSLSLGKSGYPLVVPSKSRRSSSTRPTVKPCSSSGALRQHNRKPSHRSTKSSIELPKKTTIISPTPSVPSPPIIRPSSPSPIPTHNRFDAISIPEENPTDFALALIQPLINQAINDAETKSVVRSVLTDICDRVVSNAVVVTVDTPSIHPTPSSITTTKQKKNKKKNKEAGPAASESPNAPSPITDILSSSPPPSAVPSLVDMNLVSMSTPIVSNSNVAEELSAIVEEKAEVETKKEPIIDVTSAQPLSSSQTKKLKKQNKLVKKEVVANRTRNKMRAARRMKKQEKEFEGLSREESGEKLIEILAACAGKKNRFADDDDEVWYDPSCDIAEEDLMEFGNRW